MATLFSTPDLNAPSASDPAVQKRAADAARRLKQAAGYKSTILTDLMPSDAPALKDTLG